MPGYDRPFEFEHWMSGTLRRGGETSFKVFVGNRGDRTGTFSCVDDKFLGSGEHLLATIIYCNRAGEERRAQFSLPDRC